MKPKTIHLIDVIKRMWKKKWWYMLFCSITFALACLYIVQIPRTYDAHERLAPETAGESSMGSLASLASSFGVNLGSGMSSDAITPELYPELFQSTDFIVSLFDIKVETVDGSVKCDYYDYMCDHQQSTPWAPYVKALRAKIMPKDPDVNAQAAAQSAAGGKKISAFRMSKRQQELVKMVKENITCSTDKKSGILTINVVDQDPLVCATMADSIRVRLQQFITSYRTSKAMVDVKYYKQLTEESYLEYKRANQAYTDYADTHQGATLTAVSSRETELENAMDKAYTSYTAYRTQLESAEAKIQERTPAFTLIEASSVPVKASGPKRMIFVAFMTLLSAFVLTIFFFRKELYARMQN
ncbi:MAG: Wzz/FepE/Etk N-terminal domain-containing protein [Bacteroidales bacterium]|nr:Wzz/FepE/Etk N-terminal domain-containing protein [Bacteroidales bacterium]